MNIPFKTIQLFQHLKSVNNLPILKILAEQLIDKDAQDEMAFPSYFSGNLLSRLIFFGRLSWFLEPVHIPEGSSTLDFGCGLGILAPYIVERGSQYYAIDLNPETAKRYARELKLEHSEFHHSLQSLDPKQRFDTIISFDVLEHVDDLGSVLEKFKTLLNPGGQIVICGPTENMLYKMGRRIVGFSGDYHQRNIYEIFRFTKQFNLTMKLQRTWPLPGPAALFKCGYFTL